jgi:hypothetical protein
MKDRGYEAYLSLLEKKQRPKPLPRVYRKRLTMHEIKRVADESTSGRGYDLVLYLRNAARFPDAK